MKYNNIERQNNKEIIKPIVKWVLLILIALIVLCICAIIVANKTIQ